MAVAALYSENLDPTLDSRGLEAKRSRTSGVSASNSGRVRSSRIGFNIGPLGMTYTHRRLDLDSQELERLARAFEGLVANPGRTTAPFLTPDDLDHLNGLLDQQPESQHSATDPARRRGAAAYAAVAAGRNEARPRPLLSVV